jgi:hypothetical protein
LDVGFEFGFRIALPGKAPVQPELSVFSYGANDADIDHQSLQTSPSLIGKRATSCSPEAVVGGDDDMMAIQVVDDVADQRRRRITNGELIVSGRGDRTLVIDCSIAKIKDGVSSSGHQDWDARLTPPSRQNESFVTKAHRSSPALVLGTEQIIVSIPNPPFPS